MNSTAVGTLRIGAWSVDEASLRVFKNGSEIKLQPKLMDLLLLLASQPGAVFSREDLIAQVWPETLATDDTLNNAIRKLRKVFPPDDTCSDYIETIPKRGYRLCAPVCTSEYQEDNAAPEPNEGSTKKLTSAINIGFFLILVSLSAIVYFTQQYNGEVLASGNSVDLLHPSREVFVSSREESELFPSLSSDGKKVVFLRVSKTMDSTQIIVKNLAQGDELLLHDEVGLYSNPVWSPSGEHIAYIQLSMTGCSVFTIGARGGPSTFISACSPLLISTLRPSLAWSPDGRHLIVPMFPPGKTQQALFRVDVANGNSEQISFPSEDSVGDASPTFSPSGDQLAFTRTSKFYVDSTMIVPYEKRSGPNSWIKNLKHVDVDLGPSLGLTWLDSRTLLYSSAKRSIYEIWSVDLETSETKLQGVGGKGAVHPQFNFKEKALVMADMQANANIVLRKQTDTGIEVVAELPSSKWERSGQIANNKEHIAFVRIITGGSELWLYNIAHATTERVFATQDFISSISWSPDDTKLAMNISKDTSLYIHIYERENARDYALSVSDTNSQHNPTWTSDGEHLLYTSKIGNKWQIFQINITSLKSELLVEDGGNKAVFDETSKSTYFTREDSPGFWFSSLDHNHKNTPARLSENSDQAVLSWDYENNAFYYLKSAPSIMPTIYKYDINDKTETIFYQGRIFYDMDVKDNYFVTSDLKQLSGDVFLYEYGSNRHILREDGDTEK